MTTLTSPHDLLAAVPFLIGYHPANSLVLVSVKDDCIGMALRVDFPTHRDGDITNDEDALVAHLVKEGAECALIIAYVPDDCLTGESLLLSITDSLKRAGIAVQESLLIWRGRWRSILCADRLCCPSDGQVLPDFSASRVAVEQVIQGRPMPYSDVDDLADSIAALPLSVDEGFIRAVESSVIPDDCGNLQARQREGAVGVIDLISRFIAGSLGKDFDHDQELCAKVIGRMSDIQVRDFALGSHNEATLEIYLSMWSYLTRIAPHGRVAAIASLLAAVSYEKGNGALAHKALDRALADDPSYSLALLLRRVFSAGWPPESFAQMRKDLHPKVCEAIFGI